jgi:predicted nucleic-acid-binding protein
VIGIDTSVLVRLLTGDDPAQINAAERFIAAELGPDQRGFVNIFVVCELAWTLDRRHSLRRSAIADAIESLMLSPWLMVEREDLIWIAADIFRRARCDFADVVIGLINRETGCEVTATFDRKAGELDSFRLL